MQFSKTDSTARQPHGREALALAPACDPVKAYQPWEVSDLSPCRDCFDVSDLPDDLEGHCISVVSRVTVTMDGSEWFAGGARKTIEKSAGVVTARNLCGVLFYPNASAMSCASSRLCTPAFPVAGDADGARPA